MFDFLFKKNEIPTGNASKPVVLLVLDGWGIAPPSAGNAIALAGTPNLDRLASLYPNSRLIASGEAVGLPATEVGNTEVGHLTMGAGRVIYQGLKRINISIEDRSFFENAAFLKAISYAKQNNTKLHLMGLVGSGQVHASVEHLLSLLQVLKNHEMERVYLHLFTDGRDSPPKESLEIVARIEARLKELHLGKVATISGRYYAMDRDRRWERTQKAYAAMVEGKAPLFATVSQAIESSYAKNLTDEFLEPAVIDTNGLIENNDSVIFFNYRIDRPRQLTMAFTMAEFENLKDFEFGYSSENEGHKHGVQVSSGPTFKREKWPTNLFFVTMTQYQENIPVSAIAFPPQIVDMPLAEVLSSAGLRQLHMAESEKERFVTYYFDGLHTKLYPGEEVSISPSPKVATYDKKPQMAVEDILKQFKRHLSSKQYHFYIINFANADMVGHSGNLGATIKAIKILDRVIAEFVTFALSYDATVIITSDHGNAEELITYPKSSFYFTSSKGSTNTDHSNNPVPFLVIKKELLGTKTVISPGSLADVAPTILAIMNIEKPKQMTGNNLIRLI